MYRVLDLFAGAGGMSLGFEQTGRYQIAAAVEKHPYAQTTYRRNHEHTVVLGDILEITDYNAFQQQYGEFDIVVGGPPCQGFSNANRQKNHIISQNNSLVKKYVEVIENLKPQAFVMENVRMLRSDIHRFYRSYVDQVETEQLGISMRKETLCLLNGECRVDSIEQYLINHHIISDLLLPEKSFYLLRVLLKNSYRKDKRSEVLEKNRKESVKVITSLLIRNAALSLNYRQVEWDYCIKGIASVQNRSTSSLMCFKQFEQNALQTFMEYIEGRISFEEAESQISAYINLQRLLSSVKELLDNKIIIDCLRVNETGVYADVQSFSVIEYINKKLGEHYRIDADVLNAAWFGAPQLRERYIAIGIKKDLAQANNIQPELPKAEYSPEHYRTVWDAIKDLEEVTPGYNINEPALDISNDDYIETALTDYLRNSDKLNNHIATETRETALKRFAALKPGQNFHDLDVGLIEDTYTQPERTQNSIYLRLEYDKPSGTVTNVRKSMWIHPELDRAISIREAARLQTFPDSFVFVGSKDSQYQQVGNAVPPIMAKAIATKLAELLDACTANRELQGEIADGGYLHTRATTPCDVQNTIKEHDPRIDRQEISA